MSTLVETDVHAKSILFSSINWRAAADDQGIDGALNTFGGKFSI
jgi:hypothetical protein